MGKKLKCSCDQEKLCQSFTNVPKTWNGLKSDGDVSYNIEDAKKGKLIGTLKGMPNITLLGVPPTRLSGPCSRVLRQLLTQQGYGLLPREDK